MRSSLVVLLSMSALAGCGGPDEPARIERVAQAQTLCADGPTLPGIDVSKWQGQIDWDAVAAAGVKYAFIRASHGLGELDAKFARNWAEAKRVGIVRGAYQYLEPGDDTAAQAQLLLDTMGPLDPGDLPPVLDVEKKGGKTPAQLRAATSAWLDQVQAATGRRPIVYTSPAFWADALGGTGDFVDHPLWIANYNVTCPTLAEPWTRWDLWQKSATGAVSGIVGDVDLDVFNGDAAQLASFIARSSVCGDGQCAAGESAASCAADCGACVVSAAGGLVDDHGACFEAFGKATSWRKESGGMSGGLRWTYAWDEPDQNVGTWVLDLAAAGEYLVEVHTPAPFGASTQARYRVRHAGQDDEVTLDQSAVDGWQALGPFAFAAGADQRVRLGDSTGEPFAMRRQLVFDDLRLTPVAPAPPAGDAGSDRDGGTATPAPDGGSTPPSGAEGCSLAGRTPPAASLACLLLVAALSFRRRAAR